MQVTCVTYVDGEQKIVQIMPVDLASVEHTYKIEWDNASTERPEHAFYLAWSALRRMGQERHTFEVFLDDVLGYEVIEIEAPEVKDGE